MGEAGTRRVCLTELGRKRDPKHADREGVECGRSRYPNSVRVLWDGGRTPISYHRSYIQDVGAAAAAPEPALASPDP